MRRGRLQEIIEPLETLLIQHNFRMDGKPRVKGPVRTASFIRSDGKKVEYGLKVKRDRLKDFGSGFAQYDLMVHLYGAGDPVELCKTSPVTTLSTTSSVNYNIEEKVKPNLERYL